MTKTTPKLPAHLEAAVNALYAARKERSAHPQGKFDNAGRWYPSDAENADGFTAYIRTPSRAWPYSYMQAARTKKHIMALALVAPEYVLAQAAPHMAQAQEVAA